MRREAAMNRKFQSQARIHLIAKKKARASGAFWRPLPSWLSCNCWGLRFPEFIPDVETYLPQMKEGVNL
jgi:hypothetical protein